MKKKVILVVSLFVLFSRVVSQENPEIPIENEIILTEEEATITGIIEVPKDKDTLFRDSNIWMADIFNSAENVVEYLDKEEGIILGKFYLSSDTLSIGTFRDKCKLKIEVKENKVRIKVTALYLEGTLLGEPFKSSITLKRWGIIQPEINAVILSYKLAILKDDSDW